MSKKIEIENVGPIERLEIPLPEAGGVVVLRGKHGDGKSTALRAVNRLAGGKAKGLSAKDGAERGIVELGDVRLSITQARTTKKGGAVEVGQIESKLDISKLVDPQIASGDRADAERIKALVNLAGVEARAADFHDLVGGQKAFDALLVDIGTDSPVELAGRVKRRLDTKAREFEKLSQQEAAAAEGLAAIAEGIDLAAESDEGILRTNYDRAREKLTQLKERRKAWEQQAVNREAARQKLEQAEQGYDGPDPSEAFGIVQKTAAVVQNRQREKDELEEKYNAAKEQLARAQATHTAAMNAVEQAEQHYRNIEGWRESLGTSIEAGPSDQELAEAQIRVDRELAALEQGVEIRRSKEQQGKAAAHLAEHQKYKAAAELVRGAAKGTDEVLSSLIPAGPLRVESGRLVLTSDRGTELFEDLSDGERWTIAIDLAADQISPGGLLTVPQVAWEGLTSQTKQHISDHARERGVVILTAQADDCDLTVEQHAAAHILDQTTPAPA